VLDENNKIILFRPFPKNPEEIAEKLKMSELELTENEKLIQNELWKKGYKTFVYSIRKTGAKNVETDNKATQFVKDNLRKLAVDYKFIRDQAELNQLLSKVNVELTKVQIKRGVERDKLVIQLNGAIEELDKAINIFIERLRELYGLYFPEMNRIVGDHEKFARLIRDYGSREKIEDHEIKQFAEKSMGMDFKQEDIKTAQLFATKILELYQLRESLSKQLEKLLRELVPNFTELATPMIAARIIAKAGGVEKLVKAPSSYIQLIGSEKSLFRHLKGRGKSPKYGILFMHPLIQRAPQEEKGKIARTIASKLSIAIKIDHYSRKNKADEMKKDLEEKIKDILSHKPKRTKK